MALTYKNRVAGHTVKVLEPDELAEQLATVRRRGRPLDPKRIMLAKKSRERLLVKMNDSWRWQRVDAASRDDDTAPQRIEDPGDHGVKEVNAYLADADADERERILAAERDGKARSTILEGPYAEG